MVLTIKERRLGRVIIVVALILNIVYKDSSGNLFYYAIFIAGALALAKIQKIAKEEKKIDNHEITNSEVPLDENTSNGNAILNNSEENENIDTKINKWWKSLNWQWKISLTIGGLVLIMGIINPDSLKYNTVKQSSWDNSVSQVETFLKKRYLNDPSSYESVEWGKLVQDSDGTYRVYHTFRARNKFGGMVKETMYFTLSSNGEIIDYY